MLEYHTVSLWLLCNVHFVKSTQRTRLRDLADLKARIISAVKNIDAPMLTCVCVWQELEYHIAVCRVYPWCTHRTSLVVKTNFFNIPVAVNSSIKVGPLGFLLYMFVITGNITKRHVCVCVYLCPCTCVLHKTLEHYEKPCVCVCVCVCVYTHMHARTHVRL